MAENLKLGIEINGEVGGEQRFPPPKKGPRSGGDVRPKGERGFKSLSKRKNGWSPLRGAAERERWGAPKNWGTPEIRAAVGHGQTWGASRIHPQVRPGSRAVAPVLGGGEERSPWTLP